MAESNQSDDNGLVDANVDDSDPAPPPKRQRIDPTSPQSTVDARTERSTMTDRSSFKKPSSTPLREEGTIKLVIPKLSELRDKVTTSVHVIAALPWRFMAKTECSKRTNNVKFLSVYVYCNPDNESTLWSCEAVVQIKLHNQLDPAKQFTEQFSWKFDFNSSSPGYPTFMKWDDILNAEKGFIKDDSVTVEALIVVQKPRGVRLSPVFSFTQPSEDCSDGVLVIGGVRLHVSKPYLALYSPVLADLFYGESGELDVDEVLLDDVILKEFVEFLHVIYPSHKRITADNVEYLLELGDKFEVKYVIDECERFLMCTDEISLSVKLVWADQYQLASLQDVSLRKFKTAAEVKNLKTTEEYKKLSDTTKVALLEKMFKLV